MTMQYGSIRGIDKPVSRLAQGTIMVKSSDLDASFALLDGVFELGCNLFDTGHVYGGGDNERTVGRWVNDRGLRDRVVLLAKGAHHNQDRRRVTPFDISADLHDSLARFGVESIDLYVLHRDDPDVPVGPIVEVLNEHKRAGLIRAFGGSNWSHHRVAEANAYAAEHGLEGFAVSSPQFSLAEMVREPWPGCVSISGPAGAEARRWYEQNDVALVPWSTLARGFLSGRVRRDRPAASERRDELGVECFASEPNYERVERAAKLAEDKGLTVPQVALAYVLNQPLNVYPLVGCWSVDEFRSNLDVLDVKLTEKAMAHLELRDS
jgi:aryl-alcohol dehydrogenase-like predicted oxidoreductase